MNLTIAMLNFFSGICLVWPALRLTGDLRSIREIESDLEDHRAGASSMGNDVVDVLGEVLNTIKNRTQQWNRLDTGLLYAGLCLFLFSSFLQIIVALTPNGG